jgi:hypothetical protein
MRSLPERPQAARVREAMPSEDEPSEPDPRSWIGDRIDEHRIVYPDMTCVELIEAVVDQVCQLEANAGLVPLKARRQDIRRSVAYEMRRREPRSSPVRTAAASPRASSDPIEHRPLLESPLAPGRAAR